MRLGDVDITGVETLLLDRDGTMNRLIVGDYVRSWEDFVFLPGVKEALAHFATMAKHIIIVTNQRGVGKGLYSEDDLNKIHSNMCREISDAGGRIDGIYCCYALTDDDPNRKPNIGMFRQICKDFPDVNSDTTLMIGDAESDEQFARNCGIKFIRVE